MDEQETSTDAQPASDGLPLSFDPWAELSARLLKRNPGERRAILDEHGLDSEGWKRLDDHFQRMLGDDLSEGDGELVEAYACLCVELALYPGRSQEVMKKYNLADEASMHAVDLEWQRRLSAHPDTHQRWSELYVAYREGLLRPT